MKRMLIRYQPLIYSAATGILLALSWPARGIPLLSFVALWPLLWVEDHFYRYRAETRPIRLFVHAWGAFVIFNLLTTWWIMYATLPGMLVAVLLNPVFMALPWLLMHKARRVLPGNHGQLSLLFFWLSFEYLHALWDLNWGWLDIGNVFATVPALIQWYEYTGTAGGTAWVIIINLSLFAIWKNLSGNKDTIRPALQKKKTVMLSLVAAVMLIIPVSISLTIWSNYEEVSDPVEVVIIQPSYDPYERISSFSEAEDRLLFMIELADSRITPATRFVVAPEGANPNGIWIHNDEDHFAIQLLRQHIARHQSLAWVLGSFSYRMYGSDEERPPSAEQYRHDMYYDTYNSAIMVEAGLPVSYHHKSKLVPGIERMPFYRFLKPVGKLVERFGGIQKSLGTQDHRDIFRTADGTGIAPAVCYESIYGQYLAEYIRNGAGLIFIVTNDGWWCNTPGHRQHNQYARLRAIESRRSIARSASTGISSFINQRGEVLKQTEWWEKTAISCSLNQNYKHTFFTLHGNFPGKMSLFISALLFMYMLSQNVIRKTRS